MRLSVVSPYPPEISGVGQYGWALTRWMSRAEEVDSLVVIGPRHPDAPVRSCEEALTVRRVWRKDDPRVLGDILHELSGTRPDVVWFNLGLTVFGRSKLANFLGLAAPWLVRRMGIPTVVTLHEIIEGTHLPALGLKNGPVTRFGGRVVTRMLLRSNAVCLTLKAYVDEVTREYGNENLHHVPLGSFASPEMIPTSNPGGAILMFGSFAPYKGLPVLLAAYRDLRTTHPNLRLTIAGVDHPRFPGYLRSMREGAGELPGVSWLGQVDEAEVRAVFEEAAVVVLPSTATTGASSVIHRAAAFGRPVVATDLPDLRRVAEEEDLLIEFVPPGDPHGLARALRGLLADHARCERLVAHNLASMRTMTIDETGTRYISLFGSLANGH